jgi:hypothetical protein
VTLERPLSGKEWVFLWWLLPILVLPFTYSIKNGTLMFLWVASKIERIIRLPVSSIVSASIVIFICKYEFINLIVLNNENRISNALFNKKSSIKKSLFSFLKYQCFYVQRIFSFAYISDYMFGRRPFKALNPLYHYIVPYWWNLYIFDRTSTPNTLISLWLWYKDPSIKCFKIPS